MASELPRDLVGELEKAWNTADGEGFGRPFAEDADFVNIRGEHRSLFSAVPVQGQHDWHIAAFHNTLVA